MGTINICICGGGSVAHVLAAVLGSHNGVSVNLLTRRPGDWRQIIDIDYRGIGLLTGKLNKISGEPAEVIPGAEFVFFTVPSFAYRDTWQAIKPFTPHDAAIGAFAGNGGFEWIVSDHPGVVFGMQKIPYVCRIVEYGRSVFVSGVRKEIFVGGRPSKLSPDLLGTLANLLNLEFTPLPNYLNVALAPANPIFHAVRLFSLYSQLEKQHDISLDEQFYEDWDDEASRLFLACDREIQKLTGALPADLSGLTPISAFYGAKDDQSLSKVIRGIESLKGIKAPLICTENQVGLDYGHRFMKEDVYLNLYIYTFFAELSGVSLPTISLLTNWAQSLPGSISDQPDRVRDLARSAGVTDVESVLKFYC